MLQGRRERIGPRFAPRPDHVSLPPNIDSSGKHANRQLAAWPRPPFSIALCWIVAFTLRSACSCRPAPPEIMPKPQTVLTCLRKNRSGFLVEFPWNGRVTLSWSPQVKMCQVFLIGRACDLLAVLPGTQALVGQASHSPPLGAFLSLLLPLPVDSEQAGEPLSSGLCVRNNTGNCANCCEVHSGAPSTVRVFHGWLVLTPENWTGFERGLCRCD